jgi:hypothetical protein
MQWSDSTMLTGDSLAALVRGHQPPDGRSLLIRDAESKTIEIPMGDILRIEVPNVPNSAKIGTMVGLGLDASFAALLYSIYYGLSHMGD